MTLDGLPLSTPDYSEIPPSLAEGGHHVRLEDYSFHQSKSNENNYYIAWKGAVEGGDYDGCKLDGTLDGFFTMVNGKGAFQMDRFLREGLGFSEDESATFDLNAGPKKLMGKLIGVNIKIESDEEYGDRPKVSGYFRAKTS